MGMFPHHSGAYLERYYYYRTHKQPMLHPLCRLRTSRIWSPRWSVLFTSLVLVCGGSCTKMPVALPPTILKPILVFLFFRVRYRGRSHMLSELKIHDTTLVTNMSLPWSRCFSLTPQKLYNLSYVILPSYGIILLCNLIKRPNTPMPYLSLPRSKVMWGELSNQRHSFEIPGTSEQCIETNISDFCISKTIIHENGKIAHSTVITMASIPIRLSRAYLCSVIYFTKIKISETNSF